MSATEQAEKPKARAHVYADNKRLKQEMEELRASLNAESLDLEGWMLMPQDLRDQFAARALFAESGNWSTALRRLGFRKLPKRGTGEVRVILKAVFETPGCQVLLRQDLATAEEHQAEIMARQVQISLHGTDDASVRAFQNVAKVKGWLKPEEHNVTVTMPNLYDMVVGAKTQNEPKHPILEQQRMKRALPATDVRSVLGHTPGEAVRIDAMSEAVDRERERVEVSEEDE